MQDAQRNAGPVGDDFECLITADGGTVHDLGPLVNQVLSVRHQMAMLTKRDKPDASDSPFVGPADKLTLAGVETGIRLSVHVLFGEQAETAFRERCDELEAFLKASDTTRH